MKLYHVSYDKLPGFVLRIPQNRLPGEDGVTPRICLSTSIEHCINAKPHQGEALFLAKQYGIPLAIYVYEFDSDAIPEDKLIGPDILYDRYDVFDAVQNKEYWLLDSTVPYTETRYEFVGGGFLPADDVAPYAEVLKLKLTTDRSPIAERLEKAVLVYNISFGKNFTTDAIIVNLADDIGKLLLTCENERLDACSIDMLMGQREEERMQDVLENTKQYLEKVGKSLPEK